MGYKPVGVDTDTSLFPSRVMNALKALFTLKSSLSTVATSGRYSDLSERPAIPGTADAVNAEPAGLSSATKTYLGNTYALKGQVGGGSGTATALTFSQTTAANVWTFNHSLGRFPLVAVYSSDGTLVFPDVSVTNSSITLTFADPMTGLVILI